jgi:hypothetical protein
MLILPDGFYFSADPEPSIKPLSTGMFGEFRVLGKTSHAPVCKFEQCKGMVQTPCPKSPRFTCSSLALEKNNANDWISGTKFQLILRHLELRRGMGTFGSLRLSTIARSTGRTVLLDAGEVVLQIKGGNLSISQFEVTTNQPSYNKLVVASQTAITGRIKVQNMFSQEDGIQIRFPPEFVCSVGDIQATHAALGDVYKATTNCMPIIYVKDGLLMRGSTGNVVDESALLIDEVQTDKFYLEYAISNISENRSVSIGASQCIPTSWVAHTSITCVVAAGFTVKTDTIAVVEGKQGLTAVSIFSYDSHNLHIEVPLSVTNRGAEGQSITVVGNNFGTLDLSAKICAQNSACEMTIWWSDSILACKTARSSGMSLRVITSIQISKSSISQAMSFDSVSIEARGPWSKRHYGNRADTGSASMTVHGASMGMERYSVRGRLCHTACEGTDWLSETSVTCRVGHGAAGTRRVVMTVGGRGESATQGWSVDAGSVSRMRASNRAGTGSASMTVHGASMGIVTYSGRSRHGKTRCESTEWASETSVRCLLGHGAGGTRLYVMTVGQRIGSVSKGWSVDTSRMSRTPRGNRAGTGSA